MNDFGDGNINFYRKGVYLEYRYFDSAMVNPLYPFRLGLSYISFDISVIGLNNIKEEITIKVQVKNIGNFKGKEVVQIYVCSS